MANENLTIGGVSFNRNDVKSQRVTTESVKVGGIFREAEFYNVELKDGTILKFEKQDDAREAKVSMTDDGSVNFYGLRGAEIQDTEADDKYNLLGCMGVHISANRTNDVKTGGGCTREKTTTVPADHDVINEYDRTLSDGSNQESMLNSAHALQGDEVGDGINKDKTFFYKYNRALKMEYFDYDKMNDLNL